MNFNNLISAVKYTKLAQKKQQLSVLQEIKNAD